MALSYIQRAVTQPIPQSQPYDTDQVQNSAGGYSWAVDKWTQLNRWLILGSEGGTYYIGEVDLTKANLTAVHACIAEESARVVDTVSAIIRDRRAAKPDTALYTLALCMKSADPFGRAMAKYVIPSLNLTGYQITKLAGFVNALGGWGRGTKRAFASWFLSQPARHLAYEAIKYQSRDGWALSDLLRLAHPKTDDPVRNAIFKWIVDGEYTVLDDHYTDLDPLVGYENIRTPSWPIPATQTIRDYRLPREAVPTEMLQDPAVWDALLDDMPMVATTRNLATLTRIGVLKPLGKRTDEVAARLRNPEEIARSKIHPMQILSALMTYKSGVAERGARGEGRDNTWEPIGPIVAGLEAAFPLSFVNVEPSGKRIILGIDVSGSMSGAMVNGLKNVTAHQAAAAMALVIARTEQRAYFVAFDTQAITLTIDAGVGLSHMLSQIPNGGGTDIAQPVLHALKRGVECDGFVILTDSVSWAGQRHAMDALKEYRQRVNQKAVLINVQMTSERHTNADPKDPGVLECIGFDTRTPQVITEFLRLA